MSRVGICHICGCSENEVPKLFYFPRNLERSKIWQENMGIQYRGESLHNYRICSRHFTFDSYRSPSTYTLSHSAVPTLLCMTPDPKPALGENVIPGAAITYEMSTVPAVFQEPLPSGSQSSMTLDRQGRKSYFRGIENLSQIEATPRKQKLIKMVLNREDHIRKLKKVCKTRAHDIKALSDLSDSNVVRNLFEGMPTTTSNFLISQLRCAKRHPKGKRWTLDEKIIALGLYKRSPRCYNLLRKLVSMPSRRTIVDLLKRVPFATGINTHLFLQISQSLSTEEDRRCALLLDEMDIKENLQYDVASDRILGFADMGDGVVSAKRANRALVFMLQGLGTRKWKQPVAYYFANNGCSAEDLSKCLLAVLSACKDIANLDVLTTICDMGTSNVKMLKTLGVTITRPYFEHQGNYVFAMYDPPHLLKRTAALFRKHKVVLPITMGESETPMEARFADVLEAYNIDLATPLVFRALYKIKLAHLDPKLQYAMKVNLAAQLMSRTVSSFIYTLLSRGEMEQRSLATATFIQQVDELFDSFNGTQLEPTEGKEMKCCVTKITQHMAFWKEAVKKVSSWQFQRVNKKGTVLSGKPPSQIGWLVSLNAIQGIWKTLNDKMCTKLRPRSLNQDALENLFGAIRGGCGCNDNPTTFQFVASLKTQILNGLVNQSLLGTNCMEDDGVLLDNLRCFLQPEEGTLLEDAEVMPLGVAPLHAKTEEAIIEIDVTEAVAQCTTGVLSIAYVSGFLARKLLSVVECERCKELLCASSMEPHNLFITYKEWSETTSRLIYPSENLVVAVGVAISTLELTLPSLCGTVGVSQLAALSIKEALVPYTLFCDIHNDRLTAAFITGICALDFLGGVAAITNNLKPPRKHNAV